MKILALDQFSDLGGAQQVLVETLAEMAACGWHAKVGLPGAGEVFERVREIGFAAERIECGPYGSGRKSVRDAARFVRQMPKLASQVRALADSASPDLIYVNGPRLLPAVPAGVPVVFHSHSYIGPGAIRKIAGMALRRTGARVIANCRFVAEAWRSHVPAEHIGVIYNGVRGGDIAPTMRAGREIPALACIGRIAPEKGQLDFVAAAARIHRSLPAARFRIIGAPLFGDAGAARYDRAVRLAASGLPIEFPGWIIDVSTALAEVDLLLLPCAAHEATTRVILEAYAAGVPVIAYRSGGIPEVVEEGVSGRLADSKEEMAELAIELLGRPDRLASYSRGARDCWQRRFTWQHYRQELLRFLERAAGHEIERPRAAPESRRRPGSMRIQRV